MRERAGFNAGGGEEKARRDSEIAEQRKKQLRRWRMRAELGMLLRLFSFLELWLQQRRDRLATELTQEREARLQQIGTRQRQ